jgi:hypothetical protein
MPFNVQAAPATSLPLETARSLHLSHLADHRDLDTKNDPAPQPGTSPQKSTTVKFYKVGFRISRRIFCLLFDESPFCPIPISLFQSTPSVLRHDHYFLMESQHNFPAL